MRWVSFIVVVIGLYVADALFFHGQLARETGQFANDLGHSLNQQFADLVRPLVR